MNSFLEHLEDVSYADEKEKQKELWDVSGILKNRLNEKYKFDLRPLVNNVKAGDTKTKADKMVFDLKDKYIIVDIKELHQYLKQNDLKKVYLDDLIFKLEWNIILPKI